MTVPRRNPRSRDVVHMGMSSLFTSMHRHSLDKPQLKHFAPLTTESINVAQVRELVARVDKYTGTNNMICPVIITTVDSLCEVCAS